ncbi:MAG TPA: choice-of-anchor L domain-containing protein [Bacteroidia bacterium]|nr:choice-of-anchor L domain-containing protein [Bacteroidia bacterium]
MRKIYLLFGIIFSISANLFAQLSVTPGVTPATLVNTILGTGVTVSNITYTGVASASGTFTWGASGNGGFSNGILLTSGSASIATVFNSASGQGNDNGLVATDPQLNTLTTGQTQDVCVLEFDFSVASDSVAFNYVFASDEYSDYANTGCNDVFGFFISGPGIVGQKNIAIVPGTTTPMTINNVNNGGPVPHGTLPTGPCSNCAYFRDNTVPVTYSTAYDGLTTTMVAGSLVQPCATYHIKLAIGDVCDGIFDSGVFLKGNSFSSFGSVHILANGISYNSGSTAYACTGTSVTLSVNPAPNYLWNTGATTQSIVIDENNINATGIYQFQTSFGNCFTFSTIHIVFVVPTATITPLGPTSLCPGDSVTLQANAGNSYLWSTGATTQNITVNATGTYTVTVTQNGNCSATSLPLQVTVGNSGSANISGTTSLCNGANTTLTASLGQSYLWSGGQTTQSITVSTSAIYSVTVTQAGGCTATASVSVNVNPSPVPAITGILAACQGANASLDAGAPYTSYLWNTSATTQTIAPGIAGTYTVTVTDANGCTGSTTANVTINALPTPVIAGIFSVCQGANASLNSGAGYTAYLWNTSATTQTITPGTAGTYTVTVTNGFNCTASISQNVTVNALPVPVIAGPAAFCQGNFTIFDAGAGYTNYLWSNSAATQTINISTAGTFTVTVTNANGCTGSTSKTTILNPLPVPAITGTLSVCQGTNASLSAGGPYSGYLWNTSAVTQTITPGIAGTYTVTVTDANGCTGSTTANVAVNALPTPAIAGIFSVCQGANASLNAGAGYTGYLWNTSATTQSITPGTSGTYTVTVTNGFNCTASTSQSVVVNALPVPVIGGPPAFCQGNFTVFDAGAGYTNYLWSNSAATQTINISTAGTFTVTVTNASGCTGSVSKTTIVNPLPVPNITGITSVCQGASTSFDAGAGYSGYSWSSGQAGQFISAGTAGLYTVTVTDVNGCTGSDNINLVVNPLPVPAITGNNDFCQGNSSTLNAGAGFTNYLWSNASTTQTINVNTSGNYIVTVTNGFNCTASTNMAVTVHALPNPVITGGTGICQGASTILNAGNNYSNYAWSNGAITQTISVSTAGNFTVTVTDINGCSNSASTTMVVNPLPVPAITGNNVVCQGVSTTFNAGAGYASYSWSNGSVAQTIGANTAGIYTVTVTDVNGCTGSDNINLTVNPIPTPAISGNTVFCQGNSSVLNAGAGFNSYSWSTGATSQTISVNASGTYIVTVTNNFGCSANTNKVVTVNPLPNPSITGGTGICTGSSTVLNAGNYTSYIWSTGASTQTISVSSAGNYSVTVTNNNGCVSSTSTTMVVHPLPIPAITGVTAICQGTSTAFNAGSGYVTYAWSTGSGQQTINPNTAGIYTVTVTDVNGCTGSDNISLVVNPLPTPAISGNTVFCQGDNTTLNAGAGYTSYLWSNSSTAQTINTGTGGNYIVTVQDGNGCTASATVHITVNPLPNPVISGVNPICQGANTVLNGGNFVSFAWSTGATTQTINTGTAGGYTVTVTDNKGCVNSSPAYNLVVNPLPSAAISQNSSICIGASSSFTVSFIGTPPFRYMYNNGTVNSALLTTSSSSVTINVTPNATTTYTLVSITDLHCTGTVSGAAVVTVNPLPTPAITGNNIICDGASTVFNAGAYSGYVWSTGETTQNISVNTAGSYIVTVTDGNGCVNSTSQTLIVNQTPVAAFSNDTSLTCAEPVIHFFDNSTYPAGSSFTWDFGDGAQSSELNPSHTFNEPGTYPITLTITSQQGCEGTLTQNTDIQFYPLPVSEFKTDPSEAVSVFNSFVNLVDLSQNAVTWNWDFGDGAKADVQNPKHYYDEIGKFKIHLTVTNIAGCVSRSEGEILITPFFVPNSFTPNGDGLNDVFFNSGYVMDVAAYNMIIWNRWGQKVYAADNINKTWNGTDKNGNTVPEGTYAYQIKVLTKSGKKYSYEGSVTVLR